MTSQDVSLEFTTVGHSSVGVKSTLVHSRVSQPTKLITLGNESSR
jgi:hypothetical protein